MYSKMNSTSCANNHNDVGTFGMIYGMTCDRNN